AQLCEPADSHNGDDGVFPCVEELDRLRPEVVEIVEPVLHVSAHGSLAVHRATVIDRALDRPVVDVVRPELGEGIQVTTVGGGSRVADGFDVLLRHRPRSISRNALAFLAGAVAQVSREPAPKKTWR